MVVTRLGKGALYYSGIAIASIVIAAFVIRPWVCDLTTPLRYAEDALFFLQLVKGLLDNGWILHNAFLGMPFGQTLTAVWPAALADTAPLVTMKLIGAVTGDASLTLNIFFLLTFPLTALFSMICFRQMNLDYAPSAVGSLLYSCLPFHFFRGVGHIMPNCYYIVPLSVVIMLWVYRGDAAIIERSELGKLKMRLYSRKNVLSIVVCALIAITYEYYTFFTCFFLLIAGILGSVNRKTLAPMFSSIFLVILVAVIFFGTLTPLWVEVYKGEAYYLVKRGPQDAETYGLKIAPMLLPVSGHRLEVLNDVKRRYLGSGVPLINENDSATLGMIGSLGFLSLVLWPLLRKRFINSGENSFPELIDLLSIMTIYGTLFGTIGGFSSVFAFLVSGTLRGYNRISVYLAFFSLTSVLILLTFISRKYVKSKLSWVIWGISLVIVLIGGLLDQIPSGRALYSPAAYQAIRTAYANDAQFIQKIEALVPPGSMIFQLPYAPLIQGGSIHNMGDFSHLRGYVHSRNLRWSAGVENRGKTDQWQRENIAQKPIEQGLENMAAAGFAGIYVDLYGYENGGVDIRAKLTKVLDRPPIESPDKRFLFFDIRDYASRLAVAYSASEWERKRGLMKAHPTNPLNLFLGQEVTFGGDDGTGLYLLEKGFSGPEKNFTWTSANEATIRVGLPATTGDIEMTLRAIPFEDVSMRRHRFVDIFCDRNHVARLPLLPSGQDSFPIEYKVRIKKSFLKPDEVQKISFHFDETISPKQLGLSEDPRLLGLAFVSLVFRELPNK